MQQYLITPNEVSILARSISNYVDSEKIGTFLRESETIDIKSALGDALYLDVKEHPENYKTLLNGGIYDIGCGDKRSFSGLKTALAYYTYARIVKNGDSNVTRFGFVKKENEYSSHTEFKEKVIAYNDAFSVADMYLKECVRYLDDCKIQFPLYKGNGKMKANRTICRVIGE